MIFFNKIKKAKINRNTNCENYSNRKKKVESLINTLHNPIPVDC